MQFRFRTLLIAIAVISVMISVYLHFSRRYDALELVRSRGGMICIQGDKNPYQEDNSWRAILWPVTRIRISSDLSEEETLLVLGKLNEVQSVHFYGNAVSSRIASAIGKLPNLEEFESGINTGVQSKDLKAICRAPNLRSVSLADYLERSHFRVLKETQSLTKINAQGMYLTRDNLQDLTSRPKIEELSFPLDARNILRSDVERLLERHPYMMLNCPGGKAPGRAWWDELKTRFPNARIYP